MPDPKFTWVDIDLLEPNPWNPNAMDDEMYAKAIESIHQFGFVDPITVRPGGQFAFQIIDGEHRWRAAQAHSDHCIRNKKGEYTEHIGMRRVPITDLGEIDDAIAKQLTIVLNETRGEYKPKEMGALLTSLLAAEPLPKLLEVLPFTPEKFQELAELPNINWDDLTGSKGHGGGSGSGGRAEKWVERVYRLPADAAATIDKALREAREDDSTPDWRSLQTIAEHFLGS